MPRTYLRPIALTYGPAARQAIAGGQAGPLGGSGWIGFHAAEVITRTGKNVLRDVVAYGDLNRDDRLAAIEGKRAAVAGVSVDRTQVMGIVNVTPDSFSDGGVNADFGQGLGHGMALGVEGAAILDVGGESTRPGSEGVSEDEELRRVLPVIKGLSLAGHVVSCDTRKANVMREACRVGARIINDVSALQHDPESLSAVAELNCPVVLMHAQGDPKTMQLSPVYDYVALDVFDALEARIAACVAAGIGRSQIVADPGIGFGKTFRHNLDVLNQLTVFHGLGVALMVGLSRKAFIGALTGEKAAGKRVNGSVGGAVQATLNGAHLLRVHDVKATVEALAVALAGADPEYSGL